MAPLFAFSLIVLLLVLGFASLQTVFAAMYARLLWGRSEPSGYEPVDYSPPAAIVLALRGSDPDLIENMKRLNDQEYPDYHIFIVVDSEGDAVWADVHRLIKSSSKQITAWSLMNRLDSCSLKCSSLAEAVERVDSRFEVIAFLDGDASPHRTWLRELVAAVRDPSIGVAAGNRWYVPRKATLGSMVRYFWNAGAVVQVWWNGITWAGSMAMRRRVIDEVRLVAAWRSSLSVDGAVIRQLRKFGYRAAFVPSVIMPNHEEISLGRFIPWSERQLVAAKSSGKGWSVVLFHASMLACCIVVPIMLGTIGFLSGDRATALVNLFSVVYFWMAGLISTLAIELAMRRRLRANNGDIGNATYAFYAMCLPSIVLAHLVYFRCLVNACFKTRVSWRGVEYQLHPDHRVEMLSYQPLAAVPQSKVVESVI